MHFEEIDDKIRLIPDDEKDVTRARIALSRVNHRMFLNAAIFEAGRPLPEHTGFIVALGLREMACEAVGSHSADVPVLGINTSRADFDKVTAACDLVIDDLTVNVD